jgi:hypothetical protein
MQTYPHTKVAQDPPSTSLFTPSFLAQPGLKKVRGCEAPDIFIPAAHKLCRFAGVSLRCGYLEFPFDILMELFIPLVDS